MDGGREFQLSYDASRDEYERGFLARYDVNGTRRRSRWEGGIFVALGVLTMGLNVSSIGTSDQVGWLPWLLSTFLLVWGVMRFTMWDRRWAIRRSFRANAAVLDVHVEESLDDEAAVSRGPGMESRTAWSQFTSVIECDDLLVLGLGDLRQGIHWSAPKRGLADPAEWPELVALAREKVSGPYFRSRR